MLLLRSHQHEADLTGLTIYRNGIVDWEYQCFDGSPHDADRTAAITLDILHADEWPSYPDRLERYPHMTFLGRIGLAATAYNLRVAFDSLDPVNAHLKVHDEITVTNPAQPDRGTVRITNDGAICWRCRVRNQPHGAEGLYLSQITNTITRALTSARNALEMPRQSA